MAVGIIVGKAQLLNGRERDASPLGDINFELNTITRLVATGLVDCPLREQDNKSILGPCLRDVRKDTREVFYGPCGGNQKSMVPSN